MERCVDSVPTGQLMWPWPMNERIRELTGVDVTATILGAGER